MKKISLWKERVEVRLRELFKISEPQILSEAMAYYLFQPGKRIRPLFTVAVAHALGGDEEDAITVGAAIEMIHNYSLIHDDLPPMDNDETRRGLPTCHIKFGEAVAILAGDALLNYAFEVLSDRDNFTNLTPEEILKVTRVIATKSGARGMVGGQVLDVCGEGNLEKVNLKKTAALFEACFMCGGIVARREDVLGELEETGRLVGLLFQITDDLLDRDGYYLLLGEEGTKEKAHELYSRILASVESLLGTVPQELIYLIDKIYRRIT